MRPAPVDGVSSRRLGAIARSHATAARQATAQRARRLGTPQVKKVRRFSNEAVVIRQNQTRTVRTTIAEKEEKEGGFLNFLGLKKKENKNTGPGYSMTDNPTQKGFHYGYNTWYLHGC